MKLIPIIAFVLLLLASTAGAADLSCDILNPIDFCWRSMTVPDAYSYNECMEIHCPGWKSLQPNWKEIVQPVHRPSTEDRIQALEKKVKELEEKCCPKINLNCNQKKRR